QFLLHGFALLEETSDDPHHAGGPAPPPPLPSHTTVASCRPCPGPAASIFPVGPRRKALRARRSLTTHYTAPGRRHGKHDRDSIPAHVAHASLGLMLVGLPSLCSCWRQWLHLTDFDRQSSLETLRQDVDFQRNLYAHEKMTGEDARTQRC